MIEFVRALPPFCVACAEHRWTIDYDHMPYIPFPSTWPVYTPARKVCPLLHPSPVHANSLAQLANWLESYAESLELNIWTSTTVISASQDADNKMWRVLVKRGDGEERVFVVRHFIMATGTPRSPPEIFG